MKLAFSKLSTAMLEHSWDLFQSDELGRWRHTQLHGTGHQLAKLHGLF